MSITYTNTVNIDGLEYEEIVVDRTSNIVIHSPQDKSRWVMIANRQRIVTRNGETCSEAVSSAVPTFVRTVTLNADKINNTPELTDIASSIAAIIDQEVSQQ